jgi:histidyl-tRNA synthetase
MSNSTPVQTLKGFRDFLPDQARARQFVQDRIRQTFETYGFAPLITPTLEYASLLLGKYGEEADKLLYTFQDRGERQVGLRYDQTVPTARVLAQYQGKLPKDFRRYQIQNVFRADKPQKGRFREFTQADCDIFSSSRLADAEILAVYYAVFRDLGLGSLRIEINDRQLLVNTLAEFATPEVSVFSLIQSVDKLDKLKSEEVLAELVAKGLDAEQAAMALGKLEKLEMSDSLREIAQKATQLGVPATALIFNPKIARGLDYYTGLIFEGKIPEYGAGSVGGGGRYDELIGNLAGLKMPAVGFGLGFDRIVEVCQELGKIPQDAVGPQVFVASFPDAISQNATLDFVKNLRAAAVATELSVTTDKLGKQYKIAEQKAIPFFVIIGANEIAENLVTVKDLRSGTEQKLAPDKAITLLKKGK